VRGDWGKTHGKACFDWALGTLEEDEANQMVVYYWVKNEPHTAGISDLERVG
jgi:hypothetical protein